MNAIEVGGHAARTGTTGTPSCRLFSHTDRSYTVLILNPDGSLHCEEPADPAPLHQARIELPASLALSQQFKQIVARVLHVAIDVLDFDRLELYVTDTGNDR